jgi:two-component system, chemotaxis family, protein-glutamate methylesterase/glutaminase
MSSKKIRVLVVDDSKIARLMLVHVLEQDPQILVIGSVDNGQAALDFFQVRRPDVVLMDIQMPQLDGFETTRRIMETTPVPIIICTATTDPKEVAITFRAMEAGAVACLEKPLSSEHPEFETLSATLLETVKLMSEVKVVRRWPRARQFQNMTQTRREISRVAGGISVIGIGASTGGPPALQTILASLPKDFSVPILIVQHIASGFLLGLVEWLNQTTSLEVHIASHNAVPLPGHVYLAPDDFHLAMSTDARIMLSRQAHENGLRPAVSHLFRSLAEICGPDAIGVLLTGMGKDGAAELKLMKDKGAMTIAQDRESSVVHGMPGAAIELDSATHILPADKIADSLITLVRSRQGAGAIKP